ncbi:MAG: glycosyltransferase [Acidimicrobiia bacterium]|nr:glycosyltransferase [Acidimicrobiia bacterium]
MSPDDRATASGHPSSSSFFDERLQLPLPAFDHLRDLTDENGLWEHARMTTPRIEHGFCTDDNARALVVVSREAAPTEELGHMAATYLEFLLEARTVSGTFHNRRRADGEWTDEVGSDDSQGRAWWGLGVVAHLGTTAWMRRAGADAFATCNSFDSPHLRSNAYAALGAAEMLRADPDHAAATDLLERTSEIIAGAARARIPWPENRLTYDNPRLPEALLAAGATLGNRQMVSIGIRLLEWLVGVETNGEYFSFTPSVGLTPGEPRPAFDQQPIEAWAMADACYRAWSVTGNPVWRVRAVNAARWFLGRNDTGMVLYDRVTGGTCDGLMEDSVNENRGAESTLAGIAALQIAALCTPAGDVATTH